MSTLRSTLDELRNEELRYASDEELVSSLDELQRASRVIESELARRVAEIDERGIPGRDGALAITSWLASRFQLAWSAAAGLVRRGRTLPEMPLVRDAFADGELSSSAVSALQEARQADADAFRGSESMLVDAARNLSHRDLRIAVAYWRQAVEPDVAELRAERQHEQRRLHVSPMLSGMVRVDGDLDPETGQTFITALRSIQDAETRSGPDLRTPAQRRADALEILSRSWLDRSDRPAVAGERPHIVVTVDLEALEGRTGRRCEFEDAGPITGETARRLACDASVSRVITSGRSEPLDVGRRTPVVSPAMRRAVVLRDGGCRFPGCDRPHAWCDAHHVRHWLDGGETALPNLVLLCRPHHRLVHAGFRVVMEGSGPAFFRKDGAWIEDRAPP